MTKLIGAFLWCSVVNVPIMQTMLFHPVTELLPLPNVTFVSEMMYGVIIYHLVKQLKFW
jgi:hypothetical protein